MREFKRHRSKQEALGRLFLRAGGVILLLVVTVVLGRAAWGMYSKMAAASQAQQEAEVELARLELQQQGLKTSLATDATQRGEEAQIRERYGVVKPGEGEIDVVPEKAGSTTAATAPESWWHRMFQALFVW